MVTYTCWLQPVRAGHLPVLPSPSSPSGRLPLQMPKLQARVSFQLSCWKPGGMQLWTQPLPAQPAAAPGGVRQRAAQQAWLLPAWAGCRGGAVCGTVALLCCMLLLLLPPPTLLMLCVLTQQIEGRGNGIKTNVVNNAEIAKALERPPDCELPGAAVICGCVQAGWLCAGCRPLVWMPPRRSL